MKKTDFSLEIYFLLPIYINPFIYIKYVAKVKKIELTKKRKEKEKKLTYIKQRPPHFFTKAWRFS